MRTLIIVAIAGWLLASPALGAPPVESGFYLGAAFGTTDFDDEGAFDGLGFDSEDRSLIAFGGYKFFANLAVEGRVGDLGTYSVSPAVTDERVSVDVMSLHVVGILPIGESGWEVHGQLGGGRMKFSCADCPNESVGSGGIGIRYFPRPQIGVGLQIDAYVWEDAPFDFSIGTAQLTLKYVF
jgi:hypothetical protein